MKGQYFIVSAVIIMASIFSITQTLSDFRKIDFRVVGETRETDILIQVKKTLENTARSSMMLDPKCLRFKTDITEAEKLINKTLLDMGMNLDLEYKLNMNYDLNCVSAEINFNLTSDKFFSETKIKIP